MLLEGAGRTPGLLEQHPPYERLKALGTFVVDYEIKAYCNPEAMFPLYSPLHRNILDRFNEYDVQIMTPACEDDPERPKVVSREQWFAAPADSAPTSSNGPRRAGESAAAATPGRYFLSNKVGLELGYTLATTG